MNKKKIYTLLGTIVLIISCSASLFAQKERHIIGTWVRVGQGVGLVKETALAHTNDQDYLKLAFKDNRKLSIYGSYVANGIETNYKFKKGKITYGFDQSYEVEAYSDSTLVLIELEKGKAKESLVRHYYLKEKIFLDRIEIGDGDWFINGTDTIYFASKKLYPKFQAIEYPDFHLYVHHAAKEAYNNGPNYMFASFSIESSGLVKDVEIWHHINEETDTKVVQAIQNSAGRWKMPLLNGDEVVVDMHIDDSYVRRETSKRASIALHQNEVFANNADVYTNGIVLIVQSFKLGKYEKALEYIGLCEQIAPEEPNLLYLRYRVYLAMNNEVYASKALSLVKQSRLSYLVR